MDKNGLGLAVCALFAKIIQTNHKGQKEESLEESLVKIPDPEILKKLL
jgi:hypothetical protein